MRHRLTAFLVCCAAVVLAAAAFAADGYNADIFYPTPFAGRYLTLEDAQTLPQFRWAVGGLLNYANQPVEIRTNNSRSGGVLDDVLATDLTAAFSFHDMVNIGAQVPIYWWNRSRSFADLGDGGGVSTRQNRTSLGDIRVLLKIRALEEGIWPMGVAVTPFITLPTGDRSILLGDGRVTAGLTATYEIDLVWLRMALNGGWRYRGNSDVLGARVGGNSFPLAIGLTRPIVDPLSMSLELHGEVFDSSNNERFSGNPFELDLIARYVLSKYVRELRAIGGVGVGVTNGVGSPAFRLFAGVDYSPKPVATPPPSSGNLRVTVQDKAGQPLEAEVGLEGPELRLGNTANGSFALTDMTPGDYRIRASRPDYETGTAETAVIAGQTSTATVVLQPLETRLTIIVLDKEKNQRIAGRIVFNPGAPNENAVDNPSGEYTLRVEPGLVVFTADAPGYESVMTTATADAHTTTSVTVPLRAKLTPVGKIYFDYDSPKLRPNSAPALKDVIRQIKRLQPKRVIVEGHCSDEGSREYNLKLSQKRAESVRDYLIKNGAPKNVTLQVMAYGATRPIASNETDEGKERNRRVEFIIEGE